MKKMYFYFWVSPDFETNPAIMVHRYCLKKYIHIFDELNFIVALDDILSDFNMKRVVTWLNDICGETKYNLRVVNNSKIRESTVILEDILPMIHKGDNDIVFFSHSKAITDVNMFVRNPYSTLRWVVAMYWYNLEYMDEVEQKMRDNSMYGSLLTHFKTEPNSKYLTHNKFYIGSFYWLNPKKMKENAIFSGVIPGGYDRFLAENFPLLFNEKSITSHNNAITESSVADLYYLSKEEWPAYLSCYGDSDILYKMQNEIIREVCGEEGY